ncbi:hypothetical protein OS965_41905, partial [Streptomyces sp. H27-G5]|uniref:hypothetical protein n=1 Tax=Streptomyces sp. H27-G5 TaxID=2996698 RepID=UPI002271B741
MFISINVFRAYWYSRVPSSNDRNRTRNRRDNSRASEGATARASSIRGNTDEPEPSTTDPTGGTTCTSRAGLTTAAAWDMEPFLPWTDDL